MKVELDLNEHQLDILQQFRKLYAEHQGTPASAPTLELQRIHSALSTAAQVLAEAVDKAAKAQGV
jgi:hypothetical protein